MTPPGPWITTLVFLTRLIVSGNAVTISPESSPASPPSTFDVRSFGAVGDGMTDDTTAFLSAFNGACAAESGGTIVIPDDGVFMIRSTLFAGPCRGALTIQLDGMLMAPDGPSRWLPADSTRWWILFRGVRGLEMRGGGSIHGNGQRWWDLPCKPHRRADGATPAGACDSPTMVRFLLCSDVIVRGLRLENSPKCHLRFERCERVLVGGMVISSPAGSPNTDGIHLANSRWVGVYDTSISNGDDCVSVGAGCSAVEIRNVTCRHGHGVSIGSLGGGGRRGCVADVWVRGVAVIDSANGVRIKTWQGGSGAVRRVAFEGVEVENVGRCIVVDQYYCPGKRCRNATAAVRVSGVSFVNVRGTYDGSAPPVSLACSDAVPCTGIQMAGVELVPAEGKPAVDAFCWNAFGVAEENTVPTVDCLRSDTPTAAAAAGGCRYMNTWI